MKKFMGLDGEGYTVDGEHRYVLLMNSEGEYLYNPKGISTRSCFNYLLSLPRNKILVAFGSNYDVNMMLRDISKETLTRLWKTGSCRWREYNLQWIPGKWFGITSDKYPRGIRINEVFGFFQMSFVKALERWDITVQDADELEVMKKNRSIFDEEMRERMISYCQMECELLVELMNRLRDSLEAVDIRCKQWIGAGSIALELLQREGIKKHHVSHLALDKKVQEICLASYFGGRTEVFAQGHIPQIQQYDIQSAYPHAAIMLPSLKNARFELQDYNGENLQDHAIYYVEWDLPENTIIAPFPYRSKGSICFPLNGRGWFHSQELSKAMDTYVNYLQIRKVLYLQICEFSPNPFQFIHSLFDYRRMLQTQRHAGEKCIKLGINSLYGKLAQGIGYRNQLPPFQSYYWAGHITSQTRARLLEIMLKIPHEVIMVATDGIFIRHPCRYNIPIGTNLGDWTVDTKTKAFIAQPGVYSAYQGDIEIKRSRGFFVKEIDFDLLRSGFDNHGINYIGHYPSTRFVGAGTALMRRDFKQSWRKWITTERKISLYPSTKRIRDSSERPIRHYPPRLTEPVTDSEPYRVKSNGYLDDIMDYTQGREQPLRS